ncbi:MAG: glycoside hydrolase family 43 protein [Clostridia bacterium]|nr:glycoside hydrolase family 43 protein [Clostridia bacterium]
MSSYLFPHFTDGENGDRECVWFAVSRDGLNWTDLGSDEPILYSQKGTTGIRDPFILYDEKRKKYVIIATDLCTVKGGSWEDFSARGSRNLVVWESDDLMSWSEERLVEVGVPEAGCVWAPEAVYCREKESWFVFWASRVKDKQRIYGSFTENFTDFTPAFLYIDAATDVIDTNIILDGEYYYRFSKDETNKTITVERCKKLVPDEGEKFERLSCELLDDFYGLEGPEAYQLPDGRWCLMADQYHTKGGYLPMICEELSKADFRIPDKDSYYMGKRIKRHGSIIKISDEKAEELISFYGKAE